MTWVESAQLTGTPRLPEDGANNDDFGYDVALDSGVLVVGSRFDDDAGGSSGAAYVFRRRDSGNGWSLAVKPIPQDGEFGDAYGFAVDIKDGCAAIGSPNRESDAGNLAGATFATCVLPGIDSEVPGLDLKIDCCTREDAAKQNLAYVVQLNTELDRATSAHYRVQLRDDRGNVATLEEQTITYQPGRNAVSRRGELPLDHLERSAFFTLSVFVTDELGQTHIAHRRVSTRKLR